MAQFEIQELERQRYVRILMNDEVVRAEAGAFNYMRGNITIDAPIPSLPTMLKCKVSGEPIMRPRYRGTGEIYLNSSFGGYHVFNVADEPWILENGAYWSSEDTVQLGLHREAILTSYWAGEGFVDYQTKLSGRGRAVLNARGPVEELQLGDETIAVEGKVVIARTEGVTYSVGRPTKSLLSYWLSGEDLVRRYRGPGKVLLVWTPYWNQKLYQAIKRSGREIAAI
jgi:uncharacterized protein (AIM24 family)